VLRREDTVVGKYRLEERVGRGGFGELWKAYDLMAKRMVALKEVVAQSGCRVCRGWMS
jgi:serine/threonine protein kinase